MRECIEEGVLQAYMDDELSPAMAEAVAAHLHLCQTCTAALNDALNETAIFAKALEPLMALEVPSVRLREKVDQAIAGLSQPTGSFEQQKSWSLNGWLASFAGFFKVSPGRALGFASLIAAVAFAAIFATIQLRRSVNNDAPALVAEKNRSTNAGAKESPSPTPEVNNANAPPSKDEPHPSSKPQKQKKQVKPVLVPEPHQLPQDELAKALPGEQNYLKAIDSLTVEIQASGETAMKPSLRAEYERNLAIVDQAIDSTRRVARRNPKDPDAAEFLYSSYQSKLDLLSAVAEQVRPTIAVR